MTTKGGHWPAQAGDVPSVYRVDIRVGNLDEATDFYERLLAQHGRKQAGDRCYFTCGEVTLQVMGPDVPGTMLYFTVNDLEGIYERAKELDCLSSRGGQHGPAGEIVVRPWGERSFYVMDPWDNPLCFVEDGTVFAG